MIATIDTDDLLAQHEASLDRSVGQNPSTEIIQARRIRMRLLEERAVCRRQLAIHEEWGYDVKGSSSNSSNSCAVETFRFRIKHHDKTAITAESRDERRRVVLCFAAALDGLDQRQNAIMLLESYLRNCHSLGNDNGQHVDDDDDYDDDDSSDSNDDAYTNNDNCNNFNQQQTKERHLDIPVTLALAKLYFKGNDKQNAMQLCLQILDYIRAQAHDCVTISDICDLDDAADAYHLAGWVYIHADDHTSAYRIWNEGAQLIPSCQVLNTQSKKRLCWDSQNPDEIDTISESTEPILFQPQDLIPASVPPALVSKCPALALFDPTTQQNQLVFVTKHPILSPLECDRVCQHVHDFHSQFRAGTWSTVRHASVPTTDVAVEDIPSLRPWLRNVLQYRLYPMLCTAFPKLARMKQETNARRNDYDDDHDDDTSSTTRTSRNLTIDQLRVHDAFIVRYDAERDMSLSLPEHSDTSLISFTVALNQRDQDFCGGGTWFESISKRSMTTTGKSTSTQEQSSDTANSHSDCDTLKHNDEDDSAISGGGCVVDADQGHAVAFAGPLRHAGYPVTSGCRIILVLFLYAHEFAYGPLLEDYCNKNKNNNDDDNDDAERQTTTSAGSRSLLKDKNQQVGCVDETRTATETDELDDCIDCKNQAHQAIRPSGDKPGGFVVYNQTVELVNMLNRQVASILDE
ncbi:hypothetical protein MHU86_8819 [Fragilaria crotonensis]|nr:hypothetical protein MHU86_8819 [Fragilaria crotonensis]